MLKKGLVVATNRPDNFGVFIKKWKDRLLRNDVHVYVMVDEFEGGAGATKIINLLGNHEIWECTYNHWTVERELQDASWIIPQGSSACKSWTIYKAWKDGCDIIYVLDDDCFPPEGEFFREHERNLQQTWGGCLYPTMWNIRPRGTPYGIKEQVMLSHGLWEQNADVDAVTELTGTGKEIRYLSGGVSHGALFSMSGMNIAFRREIAPLMYFGLQGRDWPYDRFDDIWCGFIAKRILDHLGYAVMSGQPTVVHSKASDPFQNIVKEAPGYKANRDFYLWIRSVQMAGTSFVECMEYIAGLMIFADRVVSEIGEDQIYWKKYGEAIQIWTKLFKEG